MTTTTPHPTARELAEKAALEIINAGYYPGDFTVQHQCASIIINATRLEALLKCAEALRSIKFECEMYAKDYPAVKYANQAQHVCNIVLFTTARAQQAETALRELDQTKG